ncbi:hypothetical protein K3495_g2407 [Podosphaera aphanis]|nr:hypothetical protein K3495_g2407 [Podosphaera aphanis]
MLLSAFSPLCDRVNRISSRHRPEPETDCFDQSFFEALHVSPNSHSSRIYPDENQSSLAKRNQNNMKPRRSRNVIRRVAHILRDRELKKMIAFRTHLEIDQNNVATALEENDGQFPLLTYDECDKLLNQVGIARWDWKLRDCRFWLWRLLLYIKHAHVQVNSKPAWCGCSACLEKVQKRFCGTGAALYIYELEDWLNVCGGNLRVAQALRDVLDTVKKKRNATEKTGIPPKERSMMLSRAYGLEDLTRGEKSMQMSLRRLRNEMMWSKYTVTTFGDDHWNAEIIETLLVDQGIQEVETEVVRPCIHMHFSSFSCHIPETKTKNTEEEGS